jgi:hypothetical protein
VCVLTLIAGFSWLVATEAPRELVYSYATQTTRSDDGDHAYGLNKMDPQGGGTFHVRNINADYRPPAALTGTQGQRTGTISVAVIREQPDGGLILHVRDGAAVAADDPITCVAFADTTVVCDPNRDTGPVIPALIAVFGKGFVDPARLDDARHWHIAAQGADGTTADYTIVRSDGARLDITETGVLTEENGHVKTTIDAKIVYDAARSLPASLDRTTVQRSRHGAITETVSTHTTLELQQ